MTRELRVEVQGELPPVKGEALSMFSARHALRHQHRLRRLLEAAEATMHGDPGLLVGPIHLELTVRAPADKRLPDATNMLGGIGDALQARSVGAEVAHLGTLADVACFEDDAQIHAITYRRMSADEVSYCVVLSLLEDHDP